MGHITVTTVIDAPIERCFDLARNVEVHAHTAAFTAERVVAPGRMSGLLELGDMVTFEGRHFGLRLRHTARIVEMERPASFIDESVRSPFRRFRHLHEFHAHHQATEVVDTLEWAAPLGVLGRIADRLFVERHMVSFVRFKQRALRGLAEVAEER